MTNQEAINNLNMISVAFVEPVTKEQRKLIDDTFDMAIKALKQEMTYGNGELPNGGWIPVSERLPEEAFGCLVTILDTDLRTQDEFENILPYFVGYDGETWNNADGEPIPFEVIAWMPLPKPYEPQESENP